MKKIGKSKLRMTTSIALSSVNGTSKVKRRWFLFILGVGSIGGVGAYFGITLNVNEQLTTREAELNNIENILSSRENATTNYQNANFKNLSVPTPVELKRENGYLIGINFDISTLKEFDGYSVSFTKKSGTNEVVYHIQKDGFKTVAQKTVMFNNYLNLSFDKWKKELDIYQLSQNNEIKLVEDVVLEEGTFEDILKSFNDEKKHANDLNESDGGIPALTESFSKLKMFIDKASNLNEAIKTYNTNEAKNINIIPGKIVEGVVIRNRTHTDIQKNINTLVNVANTLTSEQDELELIDKWEKIRALVDEAAEINQEIDEINPYQEKINQEQEFFFNLISKQKSNNNMLLFTVDSGNRKDIAFLEDNFKSKVYFDEKLIHDLLGLAILPYSETPIAGIERTYVIDGFTDDYVDITINLQALEDDMPNFTNIAITKKRVKLRLDGYRSKKTEAFEDTTPKDIEGLFMKEIGFDSTVALNANAYDWSKTYTIEAYHTNGIKLIAVIQPQATKDQLDQGFVSFDYTIAIDGLKSEKRKGYLYSDGLDSLILNLLKIDTKEAVRLLQPERPTTFPNVADKEWKDINNEIQKIINSIDALTTQSEVDNIENITAKQDVNKKKNTYLQALIAHGVTEIAKYENENKANYVDKDADDEWDVVINNIQETTILLNHATFENFDITFKKGDSKINEALVLYNLKVLDTYKTYQKNKIANSTLSQSGRLPENLQQLDWDKYLAELEVIKSAIDDLQTLDDVLNYEANRLSIDIQKIADEYTSAITKKVNIIWDEARNGIKTNTQVQHTDNIPPIHSSTSDLWKNDANSGIPKILNEWKATRNNYLDRLDNLDKNVMSKTQIEKALIDFNYVEKRDEYAKRLKEVVDVIDRYDALTKKISQTKNKALPVSRSILTTGWISDVLAIKFSISGYGATFDRNEIKISAKQDSSYNISYKVEYDQNYSWLAAHFASDEIHHNYKDTFENNVAGLKLDKNDAAEIIFLFMRNNNNRLIINFYGKGYGKIAVGFADNSWRFSSDIAVWPSDKSGEIFGTGKETLLKTKLEDCVGGGGEILLSATGAKLYIH